MKKIFLTFAALFFVGNLHSQVLDPVQYKTVRWFNEAGTQVTATSSYLTGAASAIGDTLVSDAYMLDFEEARFALSAGLGDTLYANLHVMFGTGPIRASGFYGAGAIAMEAKSDSIISLGIRQAIVGQTCKVKIQRTATGWTSTPGGSAQATGGLRDSTHTFTFPGSLNSGVYTWFKLVLIPHGAVNDVSNATILNNNMLIIKRRYSSW